MQIYYSILKVAKKLKISRQAVWKRCVNGSIKAEKIDGRWQIHHNIYKKLK